MPLLYRFLPLLVDVIGEILQMHHPGSLLARTYAKGW